MRNRISRGRHSPYSREGRYVLMHVLKPFTAGRPAGRSRQKNNWRWCHPSRRGSKGERARGGFENLFRVAIAMISRLQSNQWNYFNNNSSGPVRIGSH